MSVIDAVNYTMFGSSTAPMLDGLFAEVGNDCEIATDPDGFSQDKVFSIFNNFTNNPWVASRLVLPATNDIIGVARRVYLSSLPIAEVCAPTIIEYRGLTNNILAKLRVLPTGAMRVSVTGGVDYDTTVPVITANGWYHVEMKLDTTKNLLVDFEVRVNGVTRLDEIDAITTAQGPIAMLSEGGENENVTIGPLWYSKDYVWWDDNGTENNDFLGQVSVFWQEPDETIAAGGWISNADADAHETVAKPRYANVLTASGAIATGNQIRINTTYYNWTSGSVDAGAPAGTAANPWLVALGGTIAEALQNMYEAIGATGVAGTTYSTALTAHTTVTPFGLTDTTIAVIATDGATLLMSFTETGANTSWLSSTGFQYRVHDAIRMSSDYISAVAATGTVTFSGLPVADETVTIDGQVYVFKAAAGGALEVTIGADADETGDNFATKVNANSLVVTAANVAGVVTLTAVTAGAAGNAITLAEAATNTAVSGATLAGGEDVTYPTPFEVALAPLPDDVTTIRAVIPKVRAAKIDGGDGNIQVSFGISDPSYDDGPDTPISSAFTYWGNPTSPFVSEVNPLTATRWAPGDFNVGARIKVARTL